MQERYAWFLPHMRGDNCNVSVGRNEVQAGLTRRIGQFQLLCREKREKDKGRESEKERKVGIEYILIKAGTLATLLS